MQELEPEAEVIHKSESARKIEDGDQREHGAREEEGGHLGGHTYSEALGCHIFLIESDPDDGDDTSNESVMNVI